MTKILATFVVLLLVACISCEEGSARGGGDSTDRGGQESDTLDKDRVLALREKGGSFSPLGPFIKFSESDQREDWFSRLEILSPSPEAGPAAPSVPSIVTSEPNTPENVAWRGIERATSVKWESCVFGRHGLGGYLSQVTVIVNGESWHVIYVYDKNVC